MAGRPRKTDAEHFLAGTKSQAKPVTASPILGGRPHCPAHLSPVARKEFKRAARLMSDRQVLTPGDAALLSLYSEVYARWIQAKAEIGERLMITITVLDHNGAPIHKDVLHPLLKVVQACESRLAQVAKELSLTPLSRDKARPTSASAARDIVPGSIGAENPELFDANGRLKLVMMPSPEDLAAQDAAADAEEE